MRAIRLAFKATWAVTHEDKKIALSGKTPELYIDNQDKYALPRDAPVFGQWIVQCKGQLRTAEGLRVSVMVEDLGAAAGKARKIDITGKLNGQELPSLKLSYDLPPHGTGVLAQEVNLGDSPGGKLTVEARTDSGIPLDKPVMLDISRRKEAWPVRLKFSHMPSARIRFLPGTPTSSDTH